MFRRVVVLAALRRPVVKEHPSLLRCSTVLMQHCSLSTSTADANDSAVPQPEELLDVDDLSDVAVPVSADNELLVRKAPKSISLSSLIGSGPPRKRYVPTAVPVPPVSDVTHLAPGDDALAELDSRSADPTAEDMALDLPDGTIRVIEADMDGDDHLALEEDPGVFLLEEEMHAHAVVGLTHRAAPRRITGETEVSGSEMELVGVSMQTHAK